MQKLQRGNSWKLLKYVWPYSGLILDLKRELPTALDYQQKLHYFLHLEYPHSVSNGDKGEDHCLRAVPHKFLYSTYFVLFCPFFFFPPTFSLCLRASCPSAFRVFLSVFNAAGHVRSCLHYNMDVQCQSYKRDVSFPLQVTSTSWRWLRSTTGSPTVPCSVETYARPQGQTSCTVCCSLSTRSTRRKRLSAASSAPRLWALSSSTPASGRTTPRYIVSMISEELGSK